ncbi:MAG: hypothetical protein ACOC7T_02905 [Planctomycetota bacterium]
MADTVSTQNVIKLTCRCGEEVKLQADLLGRIVPCRHCGRYLRPALQFLLLEQELAPNLTVQCTCGHFVVAEPKRGGKRVKCPCCEKELVMPHPVMKFGSGGVIRVPRRALEKQLQRRKSSKQSKSAEVTRLEQAARSGRVSLRPGEHLCVNPDCGALLGPGANVCPKCGTNRLTGERYEGPGPESDPQGSWEQV